MCKAIDVAKWFIKVDVTGLDNSFDGNMKINKMLYFAQLISLIENKKTLFDDEMYAFEHGIVVENVRHQYKNNYYGLCHSALSDTVSFNDVDEDVLNITKNIFGNVSAEELSELTHQHDMWRDFYESSKKDGRYDKTKSKIDINRFFDDYSNDLENVKSILNAYKAIENDNIEEECISINDKKFYYDPSEISIDNNLMEKLKNFPADDGVYTICRDKTQGVIIY